LQQMSLIAMNTPQTGAPPAGQPIAQGSAAAACRLPLAGVFQALLLEALGGAQPAAPGAQPAAPGAQMMAPGGQTAPVQVLPGHVPAQDQASFAPAQAGLAPATDPVLPIRLTGPAAAPAPPEVKPVPEAAPAPPQQQEIEQPAGGGGAPEAAVMQAVQTQVLAGQTVPSTSPTLATAPDGPAAPDRAVMVISPEAPADRQLEIFVQKALHRAAGGGEAAPTTQDGQADPKQPTFEDLVRLVAEVDQAATERPGPRRPGAEAEAAPLAKPETPNAEAPAEHVAVHQEMPRVARDPAPAGGTDAAQSAPAPRQEIDPEQVLRQVTRFVKVMVQSKQSEVRLQLHPEHLGHVAVKLVVGEGALRANLVAQDAAVKAALEANLDQLRTRLADQGFQVEQVHVTVGGDGGFGQPQHSRQGEQRQPQQPWRPSYFTPAGQEEPRQTGEQRQTPVPTWAVRGTGVRLNSLA